MRDPLNGSRATSRYPNSPSYAEARLQSVRRHIEADDVATWDDSVIRDILVYDHAELFDGVKAMLKEVTEDRKTARSPAAISAINSTKTYRIFRFAGWAAVISTAVGLLQKLMS